MPGAARSTSPPRTCRSSARRGSVHHGFGFTGNGVGPTYLGGEILARLALDRRDAITGLAIVEPDRKLFPPEPLRWLGGTAIRGRARPARRRLRPRARARPGDRLRRLAAAAARAPPPALAGAVARASALSSAPIVERRARPRVARAAIDLLGRAAGRRGRGSARRRPSPSAAKSSGGQARLPPGSRRSRPSRRRSGPTWPRCSGASAARRRRDRGSGGRGRRARTRARRSRARRGAPARGAPSGPCRTRPSTS